MITPATQEDDEVGASTMTEPGQEMKIGAPMTTTSAHEESKRGTSMMASSPREERIQGAIRDEPSNGGSCCYLFFVGACFERTRFENGKDSGKK